MARSAPRPRRRWPRAPCSAPGSILRCRSPASPDPASAAPRAGGSCDEPIVLFRDSAAKAAALADRCCHRSAPLSMGKVVEAGLECGYHGLTFDGAGHCVRIPGQRQIPEDACVRSYPVVEKDQLVWLWMGGADKADPASIVDFPFHKNAGERPDTQGA